MPSEKSRQAYKTASKKPKILENEKNGTRGENTDPQEEFLFRSLDLLKEYPGSVVNQNRDKQNQDINGDKGHVEDTTGRQQPIDTPPLRQEKKDPCHYRKEERKFERIEKHLNLLKTLGENTSGQFHANDRRYWMTN